MKRKIIKEVLSALALVCFILSREDGRYQKKLEEHCSKLIEYKALIDKNI